MEVYPKFIVEINEEGEHTLVIAKCTYHNQLVNDPKKCLGGGWWKFNDDRTAVTLYGRSDEFGFADLEDIFKAFEAKNVFSSKYGTRGYCDQWEFFVDCGSFLVNLKTKEKIENI